LPNLKQEVVVEEVVLAVLLVAGFGGGKVVMREGWRRTSLVKLFG
jgi:hypothetical protein